MKNNLFINKKYQSVILSLALTILCGYQTVFARSADSEMPMNIEADRVTLNEKKGISRYTGNVKITQGSRHIKGDSLAIYVKENEVTRVVIKGKPALFKQLNDNNEETQASSHEMIYLADKDLLILKHEAILKQKDNIFHSDRISYNTAKDIITAGENSENNDQRVKITIHPKKDSDSQ